jgi:hypothetical protein
MRSTYVRPLNDSNDAPLGEGADMKTTIRKFFLGITVAALVLGGCKSDDTFYSNVLRSDVFYQLYSDTSFDFLWVMDNSGSMRPHRDFVRDNMQTFVNILTSRKAVDYQMAVVDTDMFSHNGALVSGGGKTVVKSKESANPIADFAAIMNAVSDSPTSFWEQGLESAYQAIYQHKSEFSRNGVPLVVVFLTDEQDYSCAEDCFGVEPENNTDWVPFPTSRYVDFFKNAKKSESTDLHVFPIIGMDGHPCSVASYGTRYTEVATSIDEGEDNLKGGAVGESGSICSSELKESYENIARIISDRGAIFHLSSPATGTGINIFVDGTLVPYSPDNYLYDAESNSIVFTGAVPKKGSIIEVTYAEKVN